MATPPAQQSGSNDLVFRVVVIVVAALLALGLVRLRFCYSVDLPAKPPRPEPEEVSIKQVTASVEANPIAYAGYLEQDSRTYQVTPTATPEQMAAVLPYQVESKPHTLDPAGSDRSMQAAGLELTLSIRDAKGSPRSMMVLEIKNLTDKPLAYRVVTRPDRGTKVCHRKQVFGHNAMAISPGGREVRSECMYRKGWHLEVVRVETIELPDLSYHYVSRVPPESVGIDSRVSRGHAPPVGSPCSVMLPATVKSAIASGATSWRDLIDFFARHRCETYGFPEGYKAFSRDAQAPLPVVPSR